MHVIHSGYIKYVAILCSVACEHTSQSGAVREGISRIYHDTSS